MLVVNTLSLSVDYSSTCFLVVKLLPVLIVWLKHFIN